MTSLHPWFISTYASIIEFSHRPGKQDVYVQYQKQTTQKMLHNLNQYLSFAFCLLSFAFYPKFLCELYCISCVIFQKLMLTTTKPSQNFEKDIQQLLLKFRDDIKRAINISKATLGILLDYSKAFDTINHPTLLEKCHKLNFPVQALNATGQRFRPFTLQLIYNQNRNLFKIEKLKSCIKELESDLETVSLWPSIKSLVFNNDKTKLMLFSTTQLCQRHSLNNNELFKVMRNGEPIERVNTKKILEIDFDENLSWSYHVNNVIQFSYATLRSLRRFKRP